MPTSGTISFGQLRTEIGGGSSTQSLKNGSISIAPTSQNSSTIGAAAYSMSELYGATSTPPSYLNFGSPTSTTVSSAAVVLDINIFSNTGWTITSSGSFTTTPSTGSGDGSFSFSIPVYTSTTADRTITITAVETGEPSGPSATYVITQEAAIPVSGATYLNVDDDLNIYAGAAESWQNAYVETDGEWHATPSSNSWISVVPGSGDKGMAVKVYADRNLYDNSRNGTVRFDSVGPDLYTYINVEQTACLSPDTPITMADGTFRSLEDVKIGDSVLSYRIPGLKDDETNVDTWNATLMGGEATPSTVVKLINGSFTEYYLINNLMKITYEHHVLIFRNGVYRFIPIGNVNIGDYLWSEELGNVIISSMELIKESHPFITMDVEETDVYFAHGLLVHNPNQKEDAEDDGEGGRPL